MIVANVFVTGKDHGGAGAGSASVTTMKTPARSRRERPAKPALTREGIVDAAVAVLQADGIDKLTMRRLAADLDTGPASLYVYVSSTTQIHALLIDRLLADLDLTWDATGDWTARLHRLLVDYIKLLVRHRGLARSALVTWPQGENHLDLVELVLALLSAGGVCDDRAAWGVDVLLQMATAMAAEYSARGDSSHPQTAGELQSLLANANPRRHPVLARIGGERLAGGEGGARRDWALHALIAGVALTPRRED